MHRRESSTRFLMSTRAASLRLLLWATVQRTAAWGKYERALLCGRESRSKEMQHRGARAEAGGRPSVSYICFLLVLSWYRTWLAFRVPFAAARSCVGVVALN